MNVLTICLLLSASLTRYQPQNQASGRATPDSTWREHDAAADSAAAHRDWPAYLRHVQILDSLMHHHPGVTQALARGYAQQGEIDRALQLLVDLSQTGVWRD